MKNRIVGTFAMAAVAGLTLAGCAASDGGAGKGPATAECPDGVTTLTVLRAQNTFPLDSQLEDYQATNECVEFDVTEVPFGQLADKISVLASAKSMPDIVGYDGPNTQAYASQGLLLPLDEYLPEGWHDDVIPATLTENSWDGKVYSPGLQQDALALYYNKTMTDAAGITVPDTIEDAWTWPEALEAFQACQQGSGTDITVFGLAPSRLGNGTPGAIYRDLLFQRSMGDPDAPEDSDEYKTFWALSPDGKEVDGWLNTPEAVEATTFYQNLFQGENQVTSKDPIPNALIDGKACFDLEVASMITMLEDAEVDFEWAVAPMPYFNTPIVHTGAVTLGVGATAPNPEVAAEAVVAMSTGELLTKMATENRRIPVLTSSIAEIPALSEAPYRVLVDEIQEWGQPRPLTPAFTQYAQFVTDGLRDIAYGSDPAEMLDRAAQQITPVLR
ncbi:ABC transporter substrate-binding protein [Agromyces aerolatus]|uniref:ABC transporter substrate-binding protein n=1 Tax=Agromyces sp. LY-1074 TaxID=3074080 RepID=UPI0028660CBF|nr:MULTISPECIES: extracellular solute-binding protein [unclassified Agromyces]MDR5700439.1 extracellular solute-binding protein [Agromyces sp. LY-1074]MDR5706960.1 extracellular solute-binding protein [Agromyces sp. LY-1358]